MGRRRVGRERDRGRHHRHHAEVEDEEVRREGNDAEPADDGADERRHEQVAHR